MATETRVGLYLLRGWINKFSCNSQHQIQLIHLSVTELPHTCIDTQRYLKRTVANFRCERAKKAMIHQGATVINFANELLSISLLPKTQSLFVRYRSLSSFYSPTM